MCPELHMVDVTVACVVVAVARMVDAARCRGWVVGGGGETSFFKSNVKKTSVLHSQPALPLDTYTRVLPTT